MICEMWLFIDQEPMEEDELTFSQLPVPITILLYDCDNLIDKELAVTVLAWDNDPVKGATCFSVESVAEVDSPKSTGEPP